MTVEIISRSISTTVWARAGIELAVLKNNFGILFEWPLKTGYTVKQITRLKLKHFLRYLANKIAMDLIKSKHGSTMPPPPPQHTQIDCVGKLSLFYQLAVPAVWGYSRVSLDEMAKSTLFPTARSVVTNERCIITPS